MSQGPHHTSPCLLRTSLPMGGSDKDACLRSPQPQSLRSGLPRSGLPRSGLPGSGLPGSGLPGLSTTPHTIPETGLLILLYREPPEGSVLKLDAQTSGTPGTRSQLCFLASLLKDPSPACCSASSSSGCSAFLYRILLAVLGSSSPFCYHRFPLFLRCFHHSPTCILSFHSLPSEHPTWIAAPRGLLLVSGVHTGVTAPGLSGQLTLLPHPASPSSPFPHPFSPQASAPQWLPSGSGRELSHKSAASPPPSVSLLSVFTLDRTPRPS